MSTSEQRIAKPQRVLACVLCQQRKIKCERKFPCSNCTKAGAQCVPAALLPRQRRRRFPERELLERLRKYEDLLRQNKIDFVPLHGLPSGVDTDHPGHDSPGDGQTPESHGPDDSISTAWTSSKKSIWRAMHQRSDATGPNDYDEGNETDSSTEGHLVVVKKVWEQMDLNDGPLFGTRGEGHDLSSRHPEQVQIFKLWQTYLQNVSPLLKITHTPTLQSRIIDAAGNVATITPVMEALMFSIYCVALISLSERECQQTYGRMKRDMLKDLQTACEDALRKCGFLCTDDRECLVAFLLYLISIRPHTNPKSVCAMTAIATRIAQRMGMHDEALNKRCQPFEAEMRRRLWWSVMVFDARMSELGQAKDTIMAPTWTCAPPMNVDDFNLQPDSKTAPIAHERSTEAIYAVVRSQLCDHLRHNPWYLDFVNPLLKAIANLRPSNLDVVERTIEEKYLAACNPENPLHYMTIWVARGQIAECRLFEHYSTYWKAAVSQTDAERDTAIEHAMHMLEYDTKIAASPLTKGFQWTMKYQYPMPAVIHIVQDMRRRALMKHANRAWEVMSDNYEARFCGAADSEISPFVTVLSRNVLQAWAACEQVLQRDPPRMVVDIKRRLADAETPSDTTSDTGGDFDMAFLMPQAQTLPFFWPAAGIGSDGVKMYDPASSQMMLDEAWGPIDFNNMEWGGYPTE